MTRILRLVSRYVYLSTLVFFPFLFVPRLGAPAPRLVGFVLMDCQSRSAQVSTRRNVAQLTRRSFVRELSQLSLSFTCHMFCALRLPSPSCEFPVFRCSDISVFLCSGVLVFRCSSVPMFRSSDDPVLHCSFLIPVTKLSSKF